MSAAEPTSPAAHAPQAAETAGVGLASCAADIVEIAALRGGARALREIAARHAVRLAACGEVSPTAGGLVLSVRPERWLLLTAPAAAGAVAQSWQVACAPHGAAVDLSSALAALYVSGPAMREALARGCRLDLDPQFFRAGCAAATVIAQVLVTLAALPSGMLLLTPSSTARHFREWLLGTARPFGLAPLAGVTVALLSGEFP